MAPRKRLPGRPELENLRIREKGGNTYYSWRNPLTGKEQSLKATNNEALAIDRTLKLNAIFAQKVGDQVVRDIAAAGQQNGQVKNRFGKFLPEYLRLYERDRRPSKSTLWTRKHYCKTWSEHLGKMGFAKIEVKDAKAVLKIYEDRGQPRTAIGLRSALIDIYRVAKSEGVLPAGHPNIAEIVTAPRAIVQRSRLTLDDWQAIHAKAQTMDKWVARSMELALVTGQRLSDLCIARFRRGSDWQKKWITWQHNKLKGLKSALDEHPYPHIDGDLFRVVQYKTGQLVEIPLDLRLDAVGLSVGDVITASRDRIASRWIIHHQRKRNMALPGDPVNKHTISKRFKDARTLTELDWSPNTPPSFHEQRSLSGRLYKVQHIDTQILLGHANRRMTEVYEDARGAEWTTVEIG